MRIEIEKAPNDKQALLANVPIGTLCYAPPEEDAIAVIVYSSGHQPGGRGVIWIYSHHMAVGSLTLSECQRIKVVPLEDGDRLVFSTK